MSESAYKISAPLRNLITFTGSDGKPLLVIDGEKRNIEVSEGVDVSEAAHAVLAAIGVIWPGRVATQERDTVLEEAAHECDEEAKASSEGFRDGCETCAATIRALKGTVTWSS